MPQELLNGALADAARAASEVRAAALVRIARVWNATNRDEAIRLFEQGMTEARSCPANSRGYLLQNAAPIGATIVPGAAGALAVEAAVGPSGRYVPMKLVVAMLDHGREKEAIDFLSTIEASENYPFDAAAQAFGTTRDDALRLAVLRSALRAMRSRMAAPQATPYFQLSGVTSFFARTWRRLPEDEARDFAGEFARWLVERPDERTRGSMQGLIFSSARQMQLFQVLAPLRHLHPALTDSLMDEHRELAAAAARYPFGDESIREELERAAASRPAMPVSDPADPIVAFGASGPITRSAAVRSQFNEDAFVRAGEALDADLAAPNPAPKDSWMSTQAFRRIFFEAARAEGVGALLSLDRIRDTDVRLFARIEVAAAIAGLPYVDGMSVSPPPPGFKPRSPAPPPPPGSPGAMVANLMARARARALQSQEPFKKPDGPVSPDARVAPSPRQAAGAAGGSGPDFWVIQHAPLRPVLARLYGVAPTRIDLDSSLESTRFDFSLLLPLPADRPTMLRLMREGVERAFAVGREVRVMDVDVLTAPRGIRVKPERSDHWQAGMSVGFVESVSFDREDDGTGDAALVDVLDLHAVPDLVGATPVVDPRDSMRDQRAAFRRLGARRRITGLSDTMTIAEFCETLESGLDRPLVDETGSRDVFRISAETTRDDAGATRDLLRIVCNQLGLVLTPARREIEWLMVRQGVQTGAGG